MQPRNPLAGSGGSNAGRDQQLAKIEYLVLVLNAHQPSKLATALECMQIHGVHYNYNRKIDQYIFVTNVYLEN